MATNYNPRIVTSGLVLALDGANTKSFKGEPTVNLVPNPDFASGTTSWGTYTITPTTVTVTDVPRTYGVARSVLQCVTSSTLNGGGNYGGTTQSGFSLTAGLSYTVSYYARSLSGTLSIRFSNQTGSGDESNLSHDSTVTSAWTKFTKTVTLDVAKSQTLVYNKNGSIAGATFQIADMQIEQKAYATQFAVGTRGATVATNGGWADLSGNSNHGTLVNSPTESATGGGSIVFDGVNEYITTPSNTLFYTTNSITFSVWANCSNTTPASNIMCFQKSSWEGYQIYVQGGNMLMIYSGQTGSNDFSYGTAISANTWYMFTMVIDRTAGFYYPYINGVLKTPKAITHPAISTGSTVLSLGSRSSAVDQFFAGSIANFQVYNKALTAAEVLQNFNSLRGRYGV